MRRIAAATNACVSETSRHGPCARRHPRLSRARLHTDEAAYVREQSQLQTLFATAGLDGRQIDRWALHDRDPLPTRGRDRISLQRRCAPHAVVPRPRSSRSLRDAAVLARCLQRIGHPRPAYIRKPTRCERVAKIQLAARHNGIVFYPPDGPKQHAKDAPDPTILIANPAARNLDHPSARRRIRSQRTAPTAAARSDSEGSGSSFPVR